MNNKRIRLTESQLHRVIKESVNQILNEVGETPGGQYLLGRLAARQRAQNGMRPHEWHMDAKGKSTAEEYAHEKLAKRFPDEFQRQLKKSPFEIGKLNQSNVIAAGRNDFPYGNPYKDTNWQEHN